VIFEAQAAAIPIVATDVGGVRAALGGGETGILIPPDDPQAAVDAVRRLRDDHDLRARLVRAGAAAVARQTIERQLDRVAAFFAAHLRRRAR
jgi:glycosyltransferase involved in cell wall biosynthesis